MYFSQEQVEYLRTQSPSFAKLRGKYTILVAADDYLPEGDAALRRNVPNTFSLLDLDPSLAKLSKGHLFLTEMYALAQTDYFYSQPASSSAPLVYIWRTRVFKKPVDSTFPHNCFELFATEDSV